MNTAPAQITIPHFPTNLEGSHSFSRLNLHNCPSCGYLTLFGMPGGVDAHCENCGFKEPCCSD